MHAIASVHAKHNNTPSNIAELETIAKEIASELDIKNRDLNVGFSGGEKKCNDIIQLRLLDPKIAILDEIDSGLDIDAMNKVSKGINRFFNQSKALILITHYERILKLIKPDFIHVLVDGSIVQSGDHTVAKEIEQNGYRCFE